MYGSVNCHWVLLQEVLVLLHGFSKFQLRGELPGSRQLPPGILF